MSIELNILKKVCRKCKVEKEVSEFNKAKRNRDGLQKKCKKCCSEYNKSLWAKNPDRYRKMHREYYSNNREKMLEKSKRWFLNNPEKTSQYKRKKLYDLDQNSYQEILTKQGNKCAICSNELEPGNKTHIDHCHNSLKVRGILCKKCNLGLGHFKDNIEYLQNAIDYLKEHQ